jgi:hypothetical protein
VKFSVSSGVFPSDERPGWMKTRAPRPAGEIIPEKDLKNKQFFDISSDLINLVYKGEFSWGW